MLSNVTNGMDPEAAESLYAAEDLPTQVLIIGCSIVAAVITTVAVYFLIHFCYCRTRRWEMDKEIQLYSPIMPSSIHREADPGAVSFGMPQTSSEGATGQILLTPCRNDRNVERAAPQEDNSGNLQDVSVRQAGPSDLPERHTAAAVVHRPPPNISCLTSESTPAAITDAVGYMEPKQNPLSLLRMVFPGASQKQLCHIYKLGEAFRLGTCAELKPQLGDCQPSTSRTPVDTHFRSQQSRTSPGVANGNREYSDKHTIGQAQDLSHEEGRSMVPKVCFGATGSEITYSNAHVSSCGHQICYRAKLPVVNEDSRSYQYDVLIDSEGNYLLMANGNEAHQGLDCCHSEIVIQMDEMHPLCSCAPEQLH